MLLQWSGTVRALAVIPAHDEAATLERVVRELRDRHPWLDVLVVDDASTDGTAELLPRLGVRRLQLAQRMGVGGAVRAGLRYARFLGYDVVLRLDADGQHPADGIERLVEPVATGTADAVVGSRFRDAGSYRAPLPRRAVHLALAGLLSRIARQRVSDPTSGFWAFGPRAVRLLGDHHPRGYSEPELLLFLLRNRLAVVEVPVAMRSRQGGRSTLTLPRALLALARTALAMLLVPLRRRHA